MEKELNWKEHVYGLAFFVMVSSMALSVAFNRYATMVFALVTLVNAQWTGLADRWTTRKFMLIPSLYGILVLIGMLYTANFRTGLGHLERSAFTAVLPALFLIRQPSKRQIEIALDIVVLTTIAICTYCLIVAFWKVHETGSLINVDKLTDREYYYFLNYELTEPSGLIPIYLSLFVTISIAILLVRTIVEQKYSSWTVVAIFVLHAFLFLIFALSGIVATVAVWTLISIHSFCRASVSERIRLTFVYIIVGGGLVVSLYAIEPLRDRFASKTNYSFNNVHVSHWNTVTIRLAIWECAMDLIDETPVFGFGTGDADEALAAMYERKDFGLGVMLRFNPHNQYLQSYFMFGLAGLAVAVMLIVMPAVVAFKDGNWLLFFLVVIFGLGFLTECLFAKQKGTVLFSMLFPLFYLHGRDSK